MKPISHGRKRIQRGLFVEWVPKDEFRKLVTPREVSAAASVRPETTLEDLLARCT